MGWKDDIVVTPGRAAAPQGGAWQNDPVVAAPGGKRPKPKADEGLGFYKGITRPLDNAAIWLEGAADKIGLADPINDLASHLGMTSAGKADAAHRAYVAGETAKGKKPGLLGEVGGNIVGTIPAVIATKNPLLLGGIQGAMTTEHPEDVGAVAGDAAKGVALSYLGGKVADRVVDVARPWVSPAVATMRKFGVEMTPGQMGSKAKLAREDKMRSLPIVGEMIDADRAAFADTLNRGAVNRAVMPLGLRLPDNITTGHEAVAWMQQEAGNAYNKILPGLSLQADPRIAVGLRKAWTAAQDLGPEDQARFLQLVQNKLRFDENGVLRGRNLTVALRDLRDLSAGFAKGADEDKRILGDALGDVHEGIMSALASQNPTAAKALKAANEAYRGSLVVNNAAARAAGNEGVASSGQFTLASRAVDRSKGKRMTAAGRAPMQDFTKAASAVTGKTPDSGTAGRQMATSVLANIKGALAAGGYQADKALSRVATTANASPPARAARATAARVAASPEVEPVLKRLEGLLSQYGDPAALLAAQPALRGLLAGVFGDE